MPEIVNHGRATRSMPDEKRTQLLQGANSVTSELVALVRATPYTAELLQLGELEIRENVLPAGSRTVDPDKDGLPSSLEGLTLKAVKKIVARCKTAAMLDRWASTNGDPEVRKLLEARYMELVPDDDATVEGPV